MATPRKVWADGEAGGTPIVADELNRIETELGDALEVTWAEVAGKPATFPPTIGTTATTAKAGNYVPAWADVSGKPAVIAAGADAAAARTAIGAVAATDNVATATKLAAARTIALTGDVTGTANFDGSANASITAAIGPGVIVNADVSASAAIDASKIAVAADATNGVTAGTLQAVVTALAARVKALETP